MLSIAMMLASILLLAGLTYRRFGVLEAVVCAIVISAGWILAKRRTWLFDADSIARADWWTGRTGKADWLAAVVYMLGSLLPLLWFAHFIGRGPECVRLSAPGSPRVALFAYGMLVALVPHVWLWLEASAFFEWSAAKYLGEEALRKEQRERFKLNADGAKALWVGIVALYAAVLLKVSCSCS